MLPLYIEENDSATITVYNGGHRLRKAAMSHASLQSRDSLFLRKHRLIEILTYLDVCASHNHENNTYPLLCMHTSLCVYSHGSACANHSHSSVFHLWMNIRYRFTRTLRLQKRMRHSSFAPGDLHHFNHYGKVRILIRVYCKKQTAIFCFS